MFMSLDGKGEGPGLYFVLIKILRKAKTVAFIGTEACFHLL